MNPTPENETPLTDAVINNHHRPLQQVVPSITDLVEHLSNLARELERDRKRLLNAVEYLHKMFFTIHWQSESERLGALLMRSRTLDAKLSKQTK